MRISNTIIPTLRQTPAEAEIISHQLLLRAGLLRKSAAGIYSYLPLGYKVISKISQIVRDEMNKFGGQEVMLPIMQPAELWLETGRWHVYGDEMFRLKDRHQRDFCLGPTHEEIITDLVRGDVNSYKQLPLLLYQIQNKYRDERRPRFGLMRGREFIMKDLYSFDKDEEGLAASYEKMRQAYINVFQRCGLDFRAVEADSGAIGGSSTHEFMVMADSGEATIVYCQVCDYAANIEKAPCQPINSNEDHAEDKVLALVSTPDVHTIDQLVNFLQVPAFRTVKTLVYEVAYEGDNELIAVMVRGDRELNEVKLYNLLGCTSLELANPAIVKEKLGVEVGFIGPVGLKVKIYADHEIAQMSSMVVGGNKPDFHYINAIKDRDFSIHELADLRMAEGGEPCPKCGEPLSMAQGIEVGQIFKLGTKYSDALNCKFLDENGKEKPMIMGCYGIGVSRTMAAAIEQNYDEDGIKWPISIAPYQVIIIPVNVKDENTEKASLNIYQDLMKLGIEVIIDDRNERAGVKFKDADLIGYPIRVTIGPKTLANNNLEIKLRRTKEEFTVNIDEAIDWINTKINQELDLLQPVYPKD
ncbi:MAG: proline--tRNA ligase [Bacillota bacterium]|nr:proline--tRNA ligase [Bacillota bacterium]